MKFSIVIPAYNEENLLPATLQAIGAATVDLEFETIVVDNKVPKKTPNAKISRALFPKRTQHCQSQTPARIRERDF